MRLSRSGDLSVSMAVLGLLVEQPDTGAGVGVRLLQRFPRAGWSRSSVHNNLPSLIKQGHVRLVKEGHKPALNSYEATAQGVAHFRQWMRESVAMPPVLRDALQGKLAFSTPEDLPAFAESVRQEKEAYRQMYAAAHRRFRETLQHIPQAAGTEADWEEAIGDIQAADEAEFWGQMVTRRQRLLNALDGFLKTVPAWLSAQEAANG
jgi:DNA-binding PadR family transcriptional regulator